MEPSDCLNGYSYPHFDLRSMLIHPRFHLSALALISQMSPLRHVALRPLAQYFWNFLKSMGSGE